MTLEQRGHLFTSSPLNFVITQNKLLLEEGKEPKDIDSTIALITNRMNMYLQQAQNGETELITHKISHFTELYGVIYLYFSDQNIIDILPDSFKENQGCDEEICCSNTIDPELALDLEENSNSEMDLQQEVSDDNGVIGRIESPFREINGIPKRDCFSDQVISKLQLNCPFDSKITYKIIESQYIWIKYLNRDDSDLNFCNLNNPANGCEDDELPSDNSNALWALAKVEKVEANTIWISGARILHNSNILEILPNDLAENLVKKDPSKCIFEKCSCDIEMETPVCDKIVTYSEQVMKDLEEIANQGKLDFYSSRDSIISALNIVLNMNPN